jgi:hypothetical protein
MELHARYFSKGHIRSPNLETIPTPRADEAIVLFSAGLRMLLHLVLAKILQKFLRSTAPIDIECYCSDKELYLGGQLL